MVFMNRKRLMSIWMVLTKEYEYSGLYAGNRLLENEEWHTWTFSPINNAEKNILPIPRLLKAAPNN